MPKPTTNVFRSREFWTAAVFALTGSLAFHIGARRLGLYQRLVTIAAPFDRWGLSPQELSLFVLFSAASAPLFIYLANQWRRGSRGRGGSKHGEKHEAHLSTRESAIWATLAAAMTAIFGSIRGWTRVTDDSEAYRLQASLLLEGRVAAPPPVPLAAVDNIFIVGAESATGEELWTGCYPFLAGAWTAPGELLGFPELCWVLLAPAIVICGILAFNELLSWVRAPGISSRGGASGRLATRLVALLLATSPALLTMASTLHTSLLTTFASVCQIGLLARWARCLDGSLTTTRSYSRPYPLGIAMGSVAGLMVNARPLDGSLAVVAQLAILAMLFRPKRSSSYARLAAGLATGGAPFLVLLLWYNHSTTGSFALMPYHLLTRGVSVYGFGETMYGPHSWSAAMTLATAVQLRLSHWANGQPLGIPLAATVALLLVWKGAPRMRTAAACLAGWWLFHIACYLPAPFGEASTLGVTYSVVRVIPIIMLLGLGAAQWRSFMSLPIWLSLFGWLTFVPASIPRMIQAGQQVAQPLETARDLTERHGPVFLLHGGVSLGPERGFVFHAPISLPRRPPAQWVFLSRPGSPPQAGVTLQQARELAGELPIFVVGPDPKSPDRLQVTPIR
ncbi:MAG: hypothetical protein WBG86_18000 [Polyangiales bacterium]